MKVIKIKGIASKKVSIETRKGLWKSWEVGFGAEAELAEGEDWKKASKLLDAELKALAKESLTLNGGGSNQASNTGDESFGSNATLANSYKQ